MNCHRLALAVSSIRHPSTHFTAYTYCLSCSPCSSGRESCISWPTLLSEALCQSACDIHTCMPNEPLAPCTHQPASRLQPLEPQSAGAWQSSCATVALSLTVVPVGLARSSARYALRVLACVPGIVFLCRTIVRGAGRPVYLS
jgi:hypothetical protein